MTASPLRLGIAGANPDRGWARDTHFPALAALPGLEVFAVSARTQAIADAAARVKLESGKYRVSYVEKAATPIAQFMSGFAGSRIGAALLEDSGLARAALARTMPEPKTELYNTPSELFIPVVVTRENIKAEIFDKGLNTAAEVCTGRYAEGCAELGIK